MKHRKTKENVREIAQNKHMRKNKDAMNLFFASFGIQQPNNAHRRKTQPE